jgi:hypothetical protein
LHTRSVPFDTFSHDDLLARKIPGAETHPI